MIGFEWDDEKNAANKRKHGISFEVAVKVFDDGNRTEFVERIEAGEERWHAIGVVEMRVFMVLTVVHTYREEGAKPVIRLISARRATRHERRLYAEAIL